MTSVYKKLKIICLLLSLVLILCSCKGDEGEAEYLEPEDETELKFDTILTFPYDFDEGLRPYKLGNMHNHYVTSLVMRSMVRLKSDYSYEYDLVSEIKSSDNITWYVYIEPDQTFPNGSEFTAYDLRYSVQCAMAEDSFYHTSLDIISSLNVVNSTCLKITLLSADRYFPNLLIFPVISYKTESSPVYFPGRYDFSESGTSIEATSVFYPVKRINLVQADDWDLLAYEMRLGSYSCIYRQDPVSLGNSSIGGISGLLSNRMIYVGFNSSSSFTYYADFRKAVSSAIDYDYIISSVYNNYADPPAGIYSPYFSENKYSNRKSLDLMSASLLLDGLGFTNYDSEGHRLTSKGKPVTVDILVCNETQTKVAVAKCVADCLENVGIKANVNAVSYAKYMLALDTHNYDLYIAEVRMDYDMDISKIITPKAFQIYDVSYIDYGIVQSESLFRDYCDYMGGAISISSFTESFEKIMPYSPICFLRTSMVFSRDMTFPIEGTDWDMFYNITDWK